MNTTPPIDPTPEMIRRSREAERLSLLFVIAAGIFCWYFMAAVNYGEQRQEECRAWVVQQGVSQEGEAL